jgi:hypothetical protein
VRRSDLRHANFASPLPAQVGFIRFALAISVDLG